MHNNFEWFFNVAFFTCQNVEVGEESTWDYGIDFTNKSFPIPPFTCHCDNKFCRGRQSQQD